LAPPLARDRTLTADAPALASSAPPFECNFTNARPPPPSKLASPALRKKRPSKPLCTST
jgi:hypothetical protein